LAKEYRQLEKYKAEIEKCTLCGNCRMICPVFKVHQRETASTRGRISLMNGLLTQSSIKFTPRTVDYLKMCINCQSCMRVCPPKVDYGKLITASRADITAQKEGSVLKRFFYTKILLNRKYQDLSFRIIGKIQRFFFKKQQKKGAIARFVYNLLNLDSERVLPQIALKNFFSPKKRNKIVGEHTKRVALFIGCSARYLNPETAEYLIDLLRKSHIQVLIPKDQLCCGRPALNGGDPASAKKLAINNLSVFNKMQDISAIVTMCGSCGDMLKREYPDLAGDQAETQGASNKSGFKRPVLDIMEFLKQERIALKPRYSDLTITYHHPCSQNRGGNLQKLIPEMIRNVYKEKFIEMPDAENCCGGGLGFSLNFYSTAKAISTDKLNSILQCGSDLVASGCPHCLMRIQEQAKVEHKELMVKHTIEIFDV